MRTATALAFLALASGAALAAIGDPTAQPTTRVAAVSATGNLELADSREGAPIFSAAGIAPGDTVAGTVEIAAVGNAPAALTLSQHDVLDTPGPGGGNLSQRLTMRIADVTAPGSPRTIYEGPLAPMSPRPVGRLAAGAARTFEFSATLPDTGAADQNAVQGATASVAYAWTAAEAADEPGPAPQPPGQTPGPGPTPAPPSSTPAESEPLRLQLTRARRALRHERLLLWVRCDHACTVSLRGRIRASNGPERRTARLRLTPRTAPAGKTRRLAIPLPRSLRHWLREQPGSPKLTARVALSARDAAGGRATAQRTLRLRRPR